MFTIRIIDLEVCYRVGVTEAERAEPQRLTVSVEMAVDAPRAAKSDDLADTVDYHSVCEALLGYGEGRSWKLLERLSSELAEMILKAYPVRSVRLEVRKFIIPEARHVSVSCAREAGAATGC